MRIRHNFTKGQHFFNNMAKCYNGYMVNNNNMYGCSRMFFYTSCATMVILLLLKDHVFMIDCSGFVTRCRSLPVPQDQLADQLHHGAAAAAGGGGGGEDVYR